MKRNQLLAAAALFGLASTALGAAMLSGGGQYDLSWHTIDGGGGYAAGGSFELEGTIGQHDAGPVMSGGAFALAGGFWGGGPVEGADVASIYDFVIIEGTLLAGGLPEIVSSNDSYLHTRSGFGSTLIDLHHMEAQFLATTSVNSPSTIDLTIESKINEPSGTTQVRIRNWTTGQYDLLGQYAVGLNDNVRQFSGLDGSRYVSNVGEIDVKLKVLVFRPILAYTFQSFIDQIEIVVNP